MRLALRWSVLCVACVWLAVCGFLGLARGFSCWAARVGACAGALLVVFCLRRLLWRWVCRWCWRWLAALCGRCLVSLLGLARWPRCCSAVAWLAGLLLGLCVAGGLWCLAPLRVLVCAGAVFGCLGVRVGGVPVSALFVLVFAAAACRVGGCWRACLLVVVSWFWLFFLRCVVVAAWGCVFAFCVSLPFGFVARGTGLRGGVLGPMKGWDDLEGKEECGMMRSTVSGTSRNYHALDVPVSGGGTGVLGVAENCEHLMGDHWWRRDLGCAAPYAARLS